MPSEIQDKVKRNLFVDMDQCLVHCDDDVEFSRTGTRPMWADSTCLEIFRKADNVRYLGWLRPGALELLKQLRELGEVYLLTSAHRDHAEAVNSTFKLGFSIARIFHNKIIEKEPYKNSLDLDRGLNFIIDNLDQNLNYKKVKFAALFGPVKYIQVEDYTGPIRGIDFTPEKIAEIVSKIKEW